MRENAVAEIRVLRSLVIVFGAGAVVFLLLSAGDIVAQARYMQPWWTPVAATLVFGVPPVLAVLARFLDLRTLRVLLGAYSICFSLVIVTLAPVMLVRPMPDDAAPWSLGVMALGPVAAAGAWSSAPTWGILLFNTVAMIVARDIVDANANLDHALQHGFFALAYSAIFTMMVLVSMRNARAVDRATTAARYAAARASSARARLRERTRLDALVHDEIMTALFYATVGSPELDSAVTRQAQRGLEQLRSLDSDAPSVPVLTDEFVNRLRSVSLARSELVEFHLEGVPEGEVPDEVAAAFVEAASEAVRNSLAYASEDASLPVEVTLLLAPERIVATIADDGRGFNPRAVPAHRLGIRVSIQGRMGIVPGCSASVESRPGLGTRVTLVWEKS